MTNSQPPHAQPDLIRVATQDDVFSGDLVPQSDLHPSSSAPRDERLRQTLARLATYSAVICEIAVALATTPELLARDETLERIETAPVVLTIEEVAAWQSNRVAAWFAALDGDLALTFEVVGVDQPTSALRQTAQSAHEAATVRAAIIAQARAAAAAEGDSVQIEVRARLRKTRAEADVRALLALRTQHAGSATMLAQTRIVVCYCSATWQRLLTPRALLDWETLGLAREEGRTVVVLCDATGYLAGMALEVIGALQQANGDEPRWLDFSHKAWQRFLERERETRRFSAEESVWASAPRVLTPQYLRLETRQPGLEWAAHAISGLRALLAAAFLANSVRATEDERAPSLVLRFAGTRPGSCQIDLPAVAPVPAARVGAASDPSAGAALARLAAWAYENASPDKLAIAREALARELPSGATLRLEQVEQAAPAALDSAKANFVLYLRQNSAQYIQLRQQGLDAVTEYAAGVRRAVGDLTSDVVEHVYRTVGLLLGVVIAALLQPALALNVQRLAALLYVLYIAFIVLFLLRARHQRVELEYADLEQRLANMPELSASERARLRDQPRAEAAYFQRYYNASRRLYLALGIGGLIYLLLLCSPVAAHLPLATPATTATSVPTPHHP